jgi:hypothetical protein
MNYQWNKQSIRSIVLKQPTIPIILEQATTICYNSVLSLNLLTSSAYNNLVSPAEQSFFFQSSQAEQEAKNGEVTSRCNISFETSSRRTVWSPQRVITILEAQ